MCVYINNGFCGVFLFFFFCCFFTSPQMGLHPLCWHQRMKSYLNTQRMNSDQISWKLPLGIMSRIWNSFCLEKKEFPNESCNSWFWSNEARKNWVLLQKIIGSLLLAQHKSPVSHTTLGQPLTAFPFAGPTEEKQKMFLPEIAACVNYKEYIKFNRTDS